MQVKTEKLENFAVPEKIIASHFCDKLPSGFPVLLSKGGGGVMCSPEKGPSLFTAHLPKVLDWLHGLEKPRALENEPCEVPLLLFDKELSTESILFHYDGTTQFRKTDQKICHAFL